VKKLILTAALLISTLGGGVASANGVPVKVPLSYLQGVSNWGPRGATGIAEVAIGEAYVKVDAVGLEPLSSEVYFGWLVNTESGELFAVGPLADGRGGTLRFSRDYQKIPEKGYNLFLVSVEPDGSNPTAPSSKRSIAGFFPKPVGQSQGAQVPADLPKTGGASADPPKTVEVKIPVAQPQNAPDMRPVLLMALGATLVLGAVAVGLIHRTVRRDR
jgi:hypothetical protein